MLDNSHVTKLTVQMVTAFLANNPVPARDVPDMIQHVRLTLLSLLGAVAGAAPQAAVKPAVPVKKSVTDAYIICLEDGLRFKSLKRHLRSSYGMTPEEYRAKWGLPHDYPMVAPNYAKHRSQLAKQIGLGKQRAGKRK
ncbi:MAG: MucR family transcriptional regulator [Alphaproteobacteria bacterium]